MSSVDYVYSNNTTSFIFSWEEKGEIKWIELKEKTLVSMYKECQSARKLAKVLNAFQIADRELTQPLPDYVVTALNEYNKTVDEGNK
jgi:hypothetical protein